MRKSKVQVVVLVSSNLEPTQFFVHLTSFLVIRAMILVGPLLRTWYL